MNTRAVTSQMTFKIVRALQRGRLRFNAIERSVNPPNPVQLSKHLKKMQRDGLIVRHVIQLGPPAHIEYALTQLGADLAKPAAALMDWVEANVDHIRAARDYQHAIDVCQDHNHTATTEVSR